MHKDRRGLSLKDFEEMGKQKMGAIEGGQPSGHGVRGDLRRVRGAQRQCSNSHETLPLEASLWL